MLTFASFSLLLVATIAFPVEQRTGPAVQINNGTVIGSSSDGVDSFRGVPYAQPPLGDLRLRPPQSINESLGTIDASGTQARGCPQLYTQLNTENLILDTLGIVLDLPLFQEIENIGEDCLTLDIQKPSNATSSSKLPVVFWIYGGAFEFGATSAEDGVALINKSIALGKPIVYVAVNYRIGGFGFLGGTELSEEGSTNLGLRDQRLGLQWVAENIEAFGGDPDRVVLWGQSAGSISAFDQTIINHGDNTYNGKALFRGAILDSGSMVPADVVTSSQAQKIFDDVQHYAHCDNSTNVLTCLRSVDYTTFLYAVSSVPAVIGYHALDLSYLPRPDPHDSFFSQSPELSLQAGEFTRIPVIIGDQEDEGTLFALFLQNITTGDELQEYLTSYFTTSNAAEIASGLLATYPDEPELGQPFGSPFRTNDSNNIFPEYKRIAALFGDVVLTLRRRHFLEYVSDSMPTWSYLASYLAGKPDLGTYHGTDLDFAYGHAGADAAITNTVQTYYISFFNHLDPNALGTPAPMIEWPQWEAGDSPQLLNFLALGNQLIPDTFRSHAFEYIKNHEADLRI